MLLKILYLVAISVLLVSGSSNFETQVDGRLHYLKCKAIAVIPSFTKAAPDLVTQLNAATPETATSIIEKNKGIIGPYLDSVKFIDELRINITSGKPQELVEQWFVSNKSFLAFQKKHPELKFNLSLLTASLQAPNNTQRILVVKRGGEIKIFAIEKEDTDTVAVSSPDGPDIYDFNINIPSVLCFILLAALVLFFQKRQGDMIKNLRHLNANIQRQIETVTNTQVETSRNIAAIQTKVLAIENQEKRSSAENQNDIASNKKKGKYEALPQQTEKPREVFYINNLNKDGSFPDSIRKEVAEADAALYKVTVTAENGRRAIIEPAFDQYIIRSVIRDPQFYIEPMCDSENKISADTQKVTLKQPGELVNHDGVWRVTKKAKIKYE